MTFPATVPVKQLASLHPEFADRASSYEEAATLYEGGKAIKDKVAQFLRKRPKELSDVYLVRTLNFSYTSLLGNIVGWYRSSIFKAAPQIVKKDSDQPAKGKAAAAGSFAVGDRIEATVNHMPGMAGMTGTVASINGTAYAVNFDKPMGEITNPHKWLIATEMKPLGKPGTAEPAKANGAAPGDTELPPDVEDFCEDFERDCDGGGTTFIDFWPQVLESLLLYCSGYVLVDLPTGGDGDDAPVSLAQQQRAGLLNPNLMFYDPRQIINWETDAQGNLEWIVIYVRAREQDFLGDAKVIDYWYYFDRAECALYERDVNPNENALPESATANLSAGYPRPHAMAGMNQVPVRKISVPKGLWLANRVALPLLNHLNLDNSLDFGLFQSNLAQLVIEDGPNGTYDSGMTPGGPPTASEVGYHHLPNGGKMYYLEPEGKSYKASQERIDNMEERIYKACYLQDQARTNRSTPAMQSGVSKSMDKMPSRDAMCELGDILRAAMQATMADVLIVRGFPNIVPDIRGLDFSDKATAEDLDLLEKSTVIQVNSETYEREIAKKTVRLSLPDMNPDLLDIIDAEIDANPTPSALEAQQQEQERADMLSKFSANFKGAGAMTQ